MPQNALTHTNSDSTALDLNDGTTYRLIEARGLYIVPIEHVMVPIPRKVPFALLRGVNPQVRSVELDILVYGATLGALMGAVSDLYAHFYADVFNDDRGTLTYTGWNGNTVAIKVAPHVPSGVADGTEWCWSSSQSEGATRVTLRLVAPDFTWYSTSESSNSGSLSGTSPVNISCTNNGDAPAYLRVRVNGQATSVTITDAYSKTFQFEATISAGQYVDCDFDPSALSFTRDNGDDWYNNRSSDSALIRVKPGTNNITFTGGAGGDNGTLSLTWDDRYSRHPG